MYHKNIKRVFYRLYQDRCFLRDPVSGQCSPDPGGIRLCTIDGCGIGLPEPETPGPVPGTAVPDWRIKRHH